MKSEPRLRIVLHKLIKPICVCEVDRAQAIDLLAVLNQSYEERIELARKLWAFMAEQETNAARVGGAVDFNAGVSMHYTNADGLIVRLPNVMPYRVARTYMFAVSMCGTLGTLEPLETLRRDLSSFVLGISGENPQSCPFLLQTPVSI